MNEAFVQMYNIYENYERFGGQCCLLRSAELTLRLKGVKIDYVAALPVCISKIYDILQREIATPKQTNIVSSHQLVLSSITFNKSCAQIRSLPS